MSKNPTFSIRPASSDDLDQLVAIEKRVHKSPWTREHFEEELSKDYSRLLVCTDDETDEIITSYICFWMMDDYMQILNVAVDQQFRGQGFARRLIQSMIRDAIRDEMKRLTLEVRASNVNAIGLYHSVGFHDVSVRKKFYSDGEDARVMDLILNVAKLSGSS